MDSPYLNDIKQETPYILRGVQKRRTTSDNTVSPVSRPLRHAIHVRRTVRQLYMCSVSSPSDSAVRN